MSLHVVLLFHAAISRRAQDETRNGDTQSTINVASVKTYLRDAVEASSCPTILNHGDKVILSRCYKTTDFRKLCPQSEIEAFLETDGVDNAGGNSGSTISIGKNFMLKSVKKVEAERLVLAIEDAWGWGQGRSLLDPICQIFVETDSKTAWVLGRTISLEVKTEVAAFDLKSPKFAQPDTYTMDELKICFAHTSLGILDAIARRVIVMQGGVSLPRLYPAACEPHDLKTLAYFQSYRAECDEGPFTELAQLPAHAHLQNNLVPHDFEDKIAHHSFSYGIRNDSGTAKSVIEKSISPEELTCKKLSGKWLQKDIAFKKLVGSPFISNDADTIINFKRVLETDIEFLKNQKLTDYSLFVKVYEDDDKTLEPDNIFPFTLKVHLGNSPPKYYILAIGIIDYGEEYVPMTESMKGGTTTMLEPTAYSKLFRKILGPSGYIAHIPSEK